MQVVSSAYASCINDHTRPEFAGYVHRTFPGKMYGYIPGALLYLAKMCTLLLPVHTQQQVHTTVTNMAHAYAPLLQSHVNARTPIPVELLEASGYTWHLAELQSLLGEYDMKDAELIHLGLAIQEQQARATESKLLTELEQQLQVNLDFAQPSDIIDDAFEQEWLEALYQCGEVGVIEYVRQASKKPSEAAWIHLTSSPANLPGEYKAGEPLYVLCERYNVPVNFKARST